MGQRQSIAPTLRPRLAPAPAESRYVVEASLASGGMGSVYRARDQVSGKTLALKRLLPGSSSTAATLFRREYHTLARLRHPRIIEVYDYGVDARGPYYTMELLDGQDLRALAPLSYRKACLYLRDVASSLSLLHAQRVLHRDLTPANVRLTSDGRCKLIDFGALAPFGVAEALVGTPPYVPPEALRGLPLDQRADLFSLGALAYYLLTKKNAYPARSLHELESVWARRPTPPSARLTELDDPKPELSEIPATLDELVMSLLSADPLARPASAAEVIERLDVIAQLEEDSEPTVAQSYLSSARLTGRSSELARAKELVSQALDKRGAALVIEHDTGSGATRLLTEIGLEARVLGLTVLQVDADVQRGPFAIAKAMAQKLAGALPQQARQAATADVLALGWLDAPSPDKPGPNLPPVDVTAAPGLWRVRVQSALERWFLDVADAKPLAIVVDNFQRVDEGSAALLALLAVAATHHPLVIVVAQRKDEAALAPGISRRLLDASDRLSLGPLSLDESCALVGSLFGDVPNAERVGRWLHRIASGYPHHLMELARYLVAHGLARYIDGTWVLPRELPPGLPARFEDTLDARLATLSASAFGLASALSVHEGPLSLELCASLSESHEEDPFAALAELASEGILVAFGTSYHFAQRELQKRILARVPEPEQRRLHRLLGGALLQTTSPDLATTLSAGWHLFYGGDEERGADILRRVGLDLVSTDELPEAIPALEAAVSVYRKLGRPRYQLLGLLAPLAFAGYYVDRRLADLYGDETLELLSYETGLTLTVRLRPYVGVYLALMIGLVYAILLHLFGGRGGLRVLNDRVSILGGISCALTGTSTICLDRDGAARRAAVFEPFAVMGTWHGGAFCHALARSLVRLCEDRAAETITELRALLARLDRRFGVIGLPKGLRPIIRGGILFALGALEGFADEPRALACADALESCGLRLYDMVACQIRAHHYACQGAAAAARRFEKEVEMHAVRNGSAWQAEVWAPPSKAVASSITGDLVGLKHAAEELERLTREIPSMATEALIARAGLKVLRGEHAAAIPLLENLLTERAPRSFIGWGLAVSVLATAYNETKQHERAEQLCRQALARFNDADRRMTAMNLRVEIQLAIAEAGLGQLEGANARLDELLAKHGPQQGAVTMGSLHRTRAQLALLSQDRAALEEHCERAQHWFRRTENPALIAQSERMVRLLRLSSKPPSSAGQIAAALDQLLDQPSLLLAAGQGPEDRARRVMEAALSIYGAKSGWLFGARAGGLSLLASSDDQAPPPDEMTSALAQRIGEMVAPRTMTAAQEPGVDLLAAYTVVPLSVEAADPGQELRILGAIVLTDVSVDVNTLSDQLTRRFAKALYEAADVSTMQLGR